MRQRKLLRPDVLHNIYTLTSMGVPLVTAMRQEGIAHLVTRPTVFKLLVARSMVDEGPMAVGQLVNDSLFPSWLDSGGAKVQQSPEAMDYDGLFPVGKWTCMI